MSESDTLALLEIGTIDQFEGVDGVHITALVVFCGHEFDPLHE